MICVEKFKNVLGEGKHQFEYAVSLIGQCTDDYMFYYNLTKDYYYISEKAVEKFGFPSNSFSDATEKIMKVVYEEDREKLREDVNELLNREKTAHNLEYRWVDRKGNIVWISCRGRVVSFDDDTEDLVLVGRISEIGVRKKADNVTGLKTETQIYTDFENIVNDGKEHCGYMLLIGIDNFKQLNDVHGVENGDYVLKSLAGCIKGMLQSEVYAYRMDGDGFLIVQYDNGNATMAKKLYNQIRSAISGLSSELDYKAIYTISAGIVEFTEKDEVQKILHNVNFSLGQAKRNGKNCSFIYDEEVYQKYVRKIDIQERLRQSVSDGFRGFEVYYQPIIDPDSEKVCGAEALLRWKCEDYTDVYPSEFIPILEESGLIIPVGRWVFMTAIKQCKEWQKIIPSFKINVNLSYIQIKKSDVVGDIIRCIEQEEIEPGTVVFEFTESCQIENDDTVRKLVDTFNRRGIKMAIDDFGTGYSNLTYLQDLHVNTLKVDRTFVAKALNSEFDFKLISHIINMAHNIDLQVCLEGIETVHEKERLQVLKPDYIQGFLYGRPVAKEEFEKRYIR